MPGMGGSELVARVRKAWPDLPILHLDDQSEPEPGLLPEDVPNLTKPFDLDELLERVRQLLAENATRP